MHLVVKFRSAQEAQKFMKFFGEIYDLIVAMEEFSIDVEKRIVFLTGDSTGIKDPYNTHLIVARFEEGMPLHALYVFCWLALKSSYRNKDDNAVVYVNNEAFEVVYTKRAMFDSKKILVSPQGICINDEDNSIMSYYNSYQSGLLNVFNKKRQAKHVEHIEQIMQLIVSSQSRLM